MIGDFFSNLGKSILFGVINYSYWICLFVSIVGIMLYIAGCKKAGRAVSVSIVVYILFQALRMAIE